MLSESSDIKSNLKENSALYASYASSVLVGEQVERAINGLLVHNLPFSITKRVFGYSSCTFLSVSDCACRACETRGCEHYDSVVVGSIYRNPNLHWCCGSLFWKRLM